MTRLMSVAIRIISSMPLYAQTQPDADKLKADARNAVGIIALTRIKTGPTAKLSTSSGGSLGTADVCF
jgi:hypothetical protein